MGNLCSCVDGSTSVHKKRPSQVATLLLIDGSMIEYTFPVKTVNVLARHPNHVVCPLVSLRPGLHSLCSLLPDEELQLGRLYLLLPFKGQLTQRNHMLAQPKGTAAPMPNEREQQAIGHRRSEEHAKYIRHREKSDTDLTGNIKREKVFQKSSGRDRERESVQGTPYVGSHGELRNASSTTKYNRPPSTTVCLRIPPASKRTFSGRSNTHPSRGTPEVHQACRSALRRSASWAPRLQPISETRS
ncbi:hypothetical protein KP509_13G010500 [Ceratopteris richardii]|uniref:Uncharacterized protein n=1 Tax=Ceratopteris richardii TaxID=49495 RepID=A0A8T2TDI1_CERRI|nr:hypothetical protein KP509_13G010500 [Ceratopteris richardii]